ncbi:MAG: hypothetical protein KH369_01330 [Paraclostridium bifermentans]|uniref:hypothetical protein n=1 Tax=Paraclostridium bifermentans TaxID=1490 RepID=UPI001DC66216|nr:hypothetical protein [Paraclostridium bifermentans]MBS6506805.1 hypothetical protein [Paraclostridium bifermentans]MDU3801579.1 hypothetical protein [Paraclostridium bifermentans]
MIEYFISQDNLLVVLFIPLTLIVSKIITFLKAYIRDSGELIKKFNYITIFFALVSSIALYIYNWDTYFTGMWLIVLIGSVIEYNFLYKNTESLYSENPNIFEIILNVKDILFGIFIISIPHTKIFFMIGGGGDPKVDFISKVILHIYGILLILLGNHTVLFYNKFFHKLKTNKF